MVLQPSNRADKTRRKANRKLKNLLRFPKKDELKKATTFSLHYIQLVCTSCAEAERSITSHFSNINVVRCSIATVSAASLIPKGWQISLAPTDSSFSRPKRFSSCYDVNAKHCICYRASWKRLSFGHQQVSTYLLRELPTFDWNTVPGA